MNKCIVIPDSFKGTMSAIEICDIMTKAIHTVFPECTVESVPIADGGEGTVDCFMYALNSKKIMVSTTGPYGEKIEAYYTRIGNKAIMEMACCAGLPLVGDNKDPSKTTTFGLGTLILHAIQNGCTEIVIGLGGSCTNDGGTGVARALGTTFYTSEGKIFNPKSDEFTSIAHIDNSKTEKLLSNIQITAMCDIDNPLCGPIGASAMFGPQKGASKDMVAILDKNLDALSSIIYKDLHKDVKEIPGAGAAGGMGAGIVAFLGGKLKSGIETVLDTVHFNTLLQGTDIVFTGEGKIDAQSFHGKVISGIANRTKAAHIPLTVIAGDIGDDIPEDVYDRGISGIFTINRKALPYKELKSYSPEYLKKTMLDILHFYKAK
ncbi:MAG: glycerate kinase [Treponema sp.]|nr:glycerate kinase [Treponema sp.]